MSERKQHRNKPITLTIDGKVCTGVYGETILEIARRHELYIPTMCNLSKVSPIGACRMCVVQVKGVDGNILSCQEKAVDGIEVTTSNDELQHERTNIMKLYDVNHPLQCGVCDKSGECDLQNKTLEFAVSSQEFAVKDMPRKQKSWGILGYDPSLCIMCEKCVHTCNEIIGTAALYIKPGGYKSTIDIKMSRCEQCGDCISVCPVGALVSNAYKYTANAWEANQVPASCSHCSAGCELVYDVKHAGINNPYESKITRVKNNFEFSTLCGAGRFGFEFENTNKANTKEDFMKTVEAIKNANTIKFNSYITNEEALILQKLKEKLGLKLINNDAKNYQMFMNAYSSVTGTTLYSATNKILSQSDAIIMIGTRISRDNPAVKYNVNIATKKQNAQFIYMHPIDDIALANKYTQFVKYEAGAEEAILAMLANTLIENCDDKLKAYFDDLDIGNLSGDSSVGEEELEEISKRLIKRDNKTLIIGTDIFGHENVKNIAKLVGLIDIYTDFNVLVMPSQTNTLGVSLICELDDEESGNVIGYNVKGDYTIASYGDCDFNIPALNQQEGTFTTLDLKVLNTNAALDFEGWCLNDIANEILDNKMKYTIDYTSILPVNKGFKELTFDSFDNGFDNQGNDLRGYVLDNISIEKSDVTLDEITDLNSYNGTVIYRCEPLHQFNEATAKSLLLQSDSHLRGSSSFATAAKIKAGDKVEIHFDGQVKIKTFKVDKNIKGTIALYPTFDNGLTEDKITDDYRYKQVKIQKVEV